MCLLPPICRRKCESLRHVLKNQIEFPVEARRNRHLANMASDNKGRIIRANKLMRIFEGSIGRARREQGKTSHEISDWLTRNSDNRPTREK